MARLDRVKNLTGLVECYAKNSKLREVANLVVVGGYVDVNQSRDREEMAEIQKMHSLIKQYGLHGEFRWIAAQMNRARNGELYRYIADTKGVFVQVTNKSTFRIFERFRDSSFSLFAPQPAFYEAFGLTVVESMTCGLPTFATCHGGPAEIIENGVSGFHIDPYHPEQLATTLVSFFETCNADPSHWEKISDGGLKRIYERLTSFFFLTGSTKEPYNGFTNMTASLRGLCMYRYTWKKYSERLLTLAGVYSFWKHVSKLERRETRRYLEMFYSLKYRDLVSVIHSSSLNFFA